MWALLNSQDFLLVPIQHQEGSFAWRDAHHRSMPFPCVTWMTAPDTLAGAQARGLVQAVAGHSGGLAPCGAVRSACLHYPAEKAASSTNGVHPERTGVGGCSPVSRKTRTTGGQDDGRSRFRCPFAAAMTLPGSGCGFRWPGWDRVRRPALVLLPAVLDQLLIKEEYRSRATSAASGLTKPDQVETRQRVLPQTIPGEARAGGDKRSSRCPTLSQVGLHPSSPVMVSLGCWSTPGRRGEGVELARRQ